MSTYRDIGEKESLTKTGSMLGSAIFGDSLGAWM